MHLAGAKGVNKRVYMMETRECSAFILVPEGSVPSARPLI